MTNDHRTQEWPDHTGDIANAAAPPGVVVHSARRGIGVTARVPRAAAHWLDAAARR